MRGSCASKLAALLVLLVLVWPVAAASLPRHYSSRLLSDAQLRQMPFKAVAPFPFGDRLRWVQLVGATRAEAELKSAAQGVDRVMGSTGPDFVQSSEHVSYIEGTAAVEILLLLGKPAGAAYLTLMLTKGGARKFVRVEAYILLSGVPGLRHRESLYRGLRDPMKSIRIICINHLGRYGDQDSLRELESRLAEGPSKTDGRLLKQAVLTLRDRK